MIYRKNFSHIERFVNSEVKAASHILIELVAIIGIVPILASIMRPFFHKDRENRNVSKSLFTTLMNHLTIAVLPVCGGLMITTSGCANMNNIQESQRMKVICDPYLDSKIDEGFTECLSVAVARKGKLIYSYHGTKANRPEYAKLGPHSRYQIYSTTKIFLGTCLMMLVEDGKIALNDKVQQYIPEYPHKDVEIIHLLTHTAGHKKAVAFKELDKLYRNDPPLEWKPGEKLRYFNTGYLILTDLLQRVSGKTLEEFAQERIFRPLKMTHTTFSRKTYSDTDVGFGSTPYKVPTPSDVCGAGDAGMLSTAEDLLKFTSELLRIHKTHKRGIVSPLTADAMFRRTAPVVACRSPNLCMKYNNDNPDEENRYLGTLTSPSACGHPGASGCVLVIDPENDFSYAILTNVGLKDKSNFQKIANVLAANLPDN